MLLSRPHNQIFVFFLFKFLIFMNADPAYVSTYSLVSFRAKENRAQLLVLPHSNFLILPLLGFVDGRLIKKTP
jgi:hypothetical protein